MTNHIAHFEIFANDVQRARRFYERVFGWRFEIGGPPDFYHIFTGAPVEHGISRGLIAKRQGAVANGAINSFRCTVSVSSIKETAEAIKGRVCSPTSSSLIERTALSAAAVHHPALQDPCQRCPGEDAPPCGQSRGSSS